jgi:dihydroneopterin aldolase
MAACIVDVIALRGVRAYGRHGVTQAERAREQPLDIDVFLDVDLRAAAASDALADTIDYDELHRRIVELVRTTSFALLERLAQELTASMFRDSRIAAVRIAIAKPALLEGATPTVELRRTNSAFVPRP